MPSAIGAGSAVATTLASFELGWKSHDFYAVVRVLKRLVHISGCCRKHSTPRISARTCLCTKTTHTRSSRISTSPKSVELGQHLLQILGVLSPQIRLLHLPPAAPLPALRCGAVDDGEVVEDLVVGGREEAAGADDAEAGDAHGVVHAGAGGDGVEVAHGGAFDAWGRGWVGLLGKAGGRDNQERDVRQPISKRLSSPMRITSFRLYGGNE